MAVSPEIAAAVGSALRVAIGDFDGDRRREIVLVDGARMWIVTPAGAEIASAPIARGIQQLVVADLDRDGRAEIIAGWGQTREHMDSTTAITVHRLERGALVEETVVAPATTRQDVVAIVPEPATGMVLVAYFDSKYMVRSATVRRAASGWVVDEIALIRTATSYAHGDLNGDGTPELVVGRVYGDDIGVDGDAFFLAADGRRTPIPTTRGVRSLAIADVDGDRRDELYVGDGWHQNYGKVARGLLTQVRFDTTGPRAETIEDIEGQYSVDRILPAVVDGRTVLVTSGNRHVRVFDRAGGRWRGTTIAGPARDLAVGDLDGIAGDEVLVIGDSSTVVSLTSALR